MSKNMVALVDCNNFFWSCECVWRPELRGKPGVVLSNNDGCAIARSNGAKNLGIPMGAPAFKYKEIFNKHNVTVFSSNYALYGDISSRVIDVLRSFSPEIEVYSIDESFLYLFDDLLDINYNELGKEIRAKVLQYTAITVSIGFAPTKSLAKVANRIAKKFAKRTGGTYVIDTEEKRVKALKWLEIDDVWGIGGRHAYRLKNLNVHRAYDFTIMPDNWVKKWMSVVGLRLKKDLLGIPTIAMEDLPSAKKNIATTRSFDKNYSDYITIKERVCTFAVTCSEKLRQQLSHCNALMVFLHTNGHRKDLPQYHRNIVMKLPYPSNSSIEISKFAIKGLRHIFKEGYSYKKAGVIVMDIKPVASQQIAIFENSDPRHVHLMSTVDGINRHIGVKKIKLACQDPGRTWKMRQERLSPRYTTKITEVKTVNVDVLSQQTDQKSSRDRASIQG